MKRALQIPLNSIPETGKELHLDLGPEWFARWQDEDPGLEFAGAEVTGTVRLAKHGRDVLVRGELSGALRLTCSRCLEPYGAKAQAGFDLLLVPAPEAHAAHGEELTPEDLDLDYYSGETVDLESLLKEQIILMVPLKPLCAEDCRGLCPRCGANLNRESCSCLEIKPAGPLAGLAKLKV
jgi:uncharacterized protein